MTLIYTLLISITLSLYAKPIYAAGSPQQPFTTGHAKAAKFINLHGSIVSNKVVLNWTVSENETADQFEIEKSTDGKNYVVAALVFGTDKTQADQYMFYEKASGVNTTYRIKLIKKDHEAIYSELIEINSASNSHQ